MRTYLSSMMRGILIGTAVVAITLFAGCGSDDKITSADVGQGDLNGLDFTTFISLGNSLTAGYQSAALTEKFADYSFPKQIARQVGVADDFIQPLIEDPGIGSFVENDAGVLQLLSLNPLLISPAPMSVEQLAALASPGGPANLLTNATYALPYSNLGIPGVLGAEYPTATSMASSISGSPFLDLVLRGQGTAVAQAVALTPTFATVWLGNNDVLGYAVSGGTNTNLPIPVAGVQAAVNAVVGALMGVDGCKIALATIPRVSDVPFFTTVKPYITTATGIPVLVDGEKQYWRGPGDVALGPDDLVLLTAKDSLLAGYGSVRALTSEMVLNVAEQAVTNAAITEYNAAIKAIAETPAWADRIALVDMEALFEKIASGHFYFGGVHVTTAMVTGGLFSLDGVHPNSVGYGLVANEFISAINAKFGSTIPLVNMNTLQGK